MHIHTYVRPRDGVEKERMVFRQMSEGISIQSPSLLFQYKTKFPNALLAHTRMLFHSAFRQLRLRSFAHSRVEFGCCWCRMQIRDARWKGLKPDSSAWQRAKPVWVSGIWHGHKGRWSAHWSGCIHNCAGVHVVTPLLPVMECEVGGWTTKPRWRLFSLQCLQHVSWVWDVECVLGFPVQLEQWQQPKALFR